MIPRCLRAMFLRYLIWETEHWLRDCENEGLTDGLNLRLIRAELEADRVRLALLQAPTTRTERSPA